MLFFSINFKALKRAFFIGVFIGGFMDLKYMKRALELAEKAKGNTGTNPLVGAVIVKDGKIISEGYHHYQGGDHAEIDAIKNAKKDVKDATMYVNLEPCSHYGKTPPCVDRIIKEGFKKIVIAEKDPKMIGIKKLNDAGIEVELGLLAKEARDLNKVFYNSLKNKRPFVVLKAGASLDGKIADYRGISQWITNEESRKYGHKLRAELDGIMIGINTVLQDDPSLTTRLIKGQDPIRIIVDSNLKIYLDAKILHLDSKAPTIIATSQNYDKKKFEKLSNLENVKLIITKGKEKVDLKDLMGKLFKLDIHSILLEGGAILNYSMLKEKLVDELNLFLAPKIIGGDKSFINGAFKLDEAIKLNIKESKNFNGDLFIRGEICLPD